MTKTSTRRLDEQIPTKFLTPNWDELAKVWHCFEDRGATSSMIDFLGEEITSPILYIGAGRGTIPSKLKKKGHKLTMIDSSPEMAKIASEAYGLEYIVSDVRNLDFFSFAQSYSTIICATGVLDTMNPSEKEKTLRKFGSWLYPTGSLISFSFYKSYGLKKMSKVVPCLERNCLFRNKAPLEIWHKNSNLPVDNFSLVNETLRQYFALYNSVQQSLGGSKEETYAFLQENLPDFDLLVNPEEEVSELRERNFDPVIYFCFNAKNTVMFVGRRKCFKRY